jgi:NAD(P)-dependent dehydrogenase (short-subunit alcohol dehydrogenase family)
MDIPDKIALVTGAGYGVGRGIARQLAAAGAAVVVNDVHDEHGRETVDLIESAGGKAAFVHADVTRGEEIQRMVVFAEESFGGLDILVNNAGTHYNPPFFPQAKPADWQRILTIFLRTYMTAMQLGIEAMKSRGGGAIVNIASSAGVGFRADNDWPDYAAAKAAVMRLTATLAPLKESVNVRVNCICPGWVATENVRALTNALSQEGRQRRDIPEKMLTPENIGSAVVRLVRDDSLVGRVMLYYEPGKCRIIPSDLDLFELSEEVSL